MKRAGTVLIALGLLYQSSLLAHAKATDSDAAEKLQRMERELQELLRDLKARILLVDESPQKDELKNRLAEIESRIDGPTDLYLSPASRLTPGMVAYYDRLRRRVEDCGTRHFPTRNGQKLYGQAAVAMTLNRNGELLETRILMSSGEPIVDRHISRVVSSSAPFGALPDDVSLDSDSSYRNLVFVTRFSFTRANESASQDSEPEVVPNNEQCKFNQRGKQAR